MPVGAGQLYRFIGRGLNELISLGKTFWLLELTLEVLAYVLILIYDVANIVELLIVKSTSRRHRLRLKSIWLWTAGHVIERSRLSNTRRHSVVCWSQFRLFRSSWRFHFPIWEENQLLRVGWGARRVTIFAVESLDSPRWILASILTRNFNDLDSLICCGFYKIRQINSLWDSWCFSKPRGYEDIKQSTEDHRHRENAANNDFRVEISVPFAAVACCVIVVSASTSIDVFTKTFPQNFTGTLPEQSELSNVGIHCCLVTFMYEPKLRRKCITWENSTS